MERNAVETAARRDRFARFLIVVITLATFGPYLYGGMRTEQLVVYLIGVLTVPVLGGLRPSGGLRFLIPWLGYIVIASLAVIAPSQMVAPQLPGSLLAGYDNIVPPLLIMLIVWTLIPETSALGVLTLFGKMLATIMALNGILAMVATRFDITALLRPFWASTDAAPNATVAALAQMMGRYGGIFNQPAEAGIAYSLAGVAAIFVWKTRPGLLALVLVPITVGGLICVSKVFVLGGLPVIIVYWMIAQRGGRRVTTVFALALVSLGVLQSGLLEQWTGFNYLARLINPDSDGGALAFYTAGRLATNSTYNNVIGDALGYSPVVGVGAGGWAVPYDGAIPEALVVGGLIGLALYVAVILGLFTLARGGVDKEIRRFAFFFAVVVAGACFGISPLTANRVSTIIWVTIALLVLVRRSAPQSDDQRDAGGAPVRSSNKSGRGQRERARYGGRVSRPVQTQVQPGDRGLHTP